MNPDFQLQSKAFKYGENIPVLHSETRAGKNVSPPLEWQNPPQGTRSFALIVVDPDIPLGLGVFVHWVVYNIPVTAKALPEGIPYQAVFSDGMIQGKNGFGQNGYTGPNPIWGRHRYYFTIYALDTELQADPRLTRQKLLQVMKGHILGQAQLMGCYSKK